MLAHSSTLFSRSLYVCGDPETDKTMWMDHTNIDEILVMKLRLNDSFPIKCGDSVLLKTGICIGCHPDTPLMIGCLDLPDNAALSVKDAYLDQKNRQLVIYMRNISINEILFISKESPRLFLKCLRKGVMPVVVNSPSYIRKLPQPDLRSTVEDGVAAVVAAENAKLAPLKGILKGQSQGLLSVSNNNDLEISTTSGKPPSTPRSPPPQEFALDLSCKRVDDPSSEQPCKKPKASSADENHNEIAVAPVNGAQALDKNEASEVDMAFVDPEAVTDDETIPDGAPEKPDYTMRGSFPPPPSPPKNPQPPFGPRDGSPSLLTSDEADKDLFILMTNGVGYTEEDWCSIFSRALMLRPLPKAGYSYNDVGHSDAIHLMPMCKDQIPTWKSVQKIGSNTNVVTGKKTTRVQFAKLTRIVEED